MSQERNAGVRRAAFRLIAWCQGRRSVATGLAIDGTGFEVLAGDERIGSRRSISAADVEFLNGLASRYVRAVQAGSADGVFVQLGRELGRRMGRRDCGGSGRGDGSRRGD